MLKKKNSRSSKTMTAKAKALRKPIYKRQWFWLVIVLVVLSACAPKDGTTKRAKETPAVSESATTAPADPKVEAQENLKAKLSDGSVLFSSSVRNDVTDLWRLLRYYSGVDILPYALDYYEAFFASDDEVHCVVNLGLETTTVITASGGMLFAQVHEYVDGEEHDAKILGGGTLLKSYNIDMASGEIEDVTGS